MILKATTKTSFGKMNKMGKQLSLPSARRNLKQERIGSDTLRFELGTYLDQKLIKYNDFVYKELILFSMADLQRSIPSITSGVTSSMLLLVTWNSELPIRRWTQDYKEFLESITTGNDCPFTLVYWSV
ncbi:hypothetical protein RHGRI_023371 [Rhododendron griersonianum]|uniref:DNA topoisomerase (ATP-hydrolyzing) n=1 Tax=Rhododendron griersonianum TaxID=479676 RepID=A0AAV6J753_9ERIC|nr:hypothetical protein RHGRI_023371 [Rhododendron griersonianum]